jgi:hypothetical protein
VNAKEVIEAYVTDVATQLPRGQRNDVAFELRALLGEELQARVDAAGREADADMATELLRAFGRPAEVAARYRPTLTIIDPADGHFFLRATVVGLVVVWTLGLLVSLRAPIGSASDLLVALGYWWGNTVIPSLWWPGLLVVYFGVASWSRRRWPRSAEWKPRPSDHIHGGRAALALALVGILLGLFILLEPRRVLDVFWGGRAAPAAYEALTYTESFRRQLGPWLLVLVALNIPLFVTTLVSGRRSRLMRRVEVALSLVDCAVLSYTALAGPVFMTASSDRTAKFLLLLIVAVTLLDLLIKQRRSVRPAPSR